MVVFEIEALLQSCEKICEEEGSKIMDEYIFVMKFYFHGSFFLMIFLFPHRLRLFFSSVFCLVAQGLQSDYDLPADMVKGISSSA